MARMHARRRGKSGSTRPATQGDLPWVKYKPAEVEQLVVKLAKQGNNANKIGVILRDSYGIGDIKQITTKKVGVILKENNLAPEFPEDLASLIRRSIQVKKHLGTNKKDKVSARGLQLINSKIRRLEKYYKGAGVLSSDYSRKRAELSIR